MPYMDIMGFDSFKSLFEGKIPMYRNGDVGKPYKTMRVVDVIRDLGKIFNAGEPCTLIINTAGVKGADEMHPEVDVIGIEGEGEEGRVRVRDVKGNEYTLKTGKILEIFMGNSVQYQVFLGLKYMIDGKKVRVKSFDGKVVTLDTTDGPQEVTPEDWKRLRKIQID
jgi:hypothetical protein